MTAERPGRTLRCIEVLAHEIVDGMIVPTCHRPDRHAIDTSYD